ncbi:tetratricopeptide repeat protein [Dactylosporangium siamense]|uniref:Tetratrico peptide repeat group 5 domain-containing protein n=1 Tax=Dactylosporangium siamense TaxID=685454 RepID=A0A919PXI6_9ACTN|nr:tetratricopeptide repeat protein [Dactylosporangium siamense]GIG50343.1 hypothetical protein Dsi01nite_083840 [Dactylosporangium siamense]
MGLAERIEATWAEADRDAPEPTLTRFRALLDEHPDDVAALYAHACALDFAGHPAEAAPAYERAFAAGLTGAELKAGLLQYGSTLRNLGRLDEATSALFDADRRFPGDAAVTVYLALALLSADQSGEAVRRLVDLALDRIDDPGLRRYQWALRRYAAALTDDDGQHP